jgi:4'-phosphopantetheinyl transferase
MYSLEPGHIDVWQIELSAPPSAGHAECVLGAAELIRARRIRRPADARRFVVCHCGVREVIGRYLGIAPAEVAFSYSPAGKPALASAGADSGLTFNLSHSGELALLAVGVGSPVGVDVERLGSKSNWELIARRVFVPGELARLLALPGAEGRAAAFCAHWTRKEAYLKALGSGLRKPLDSFWVVPGPRGGPYRTQTVGEEVGAPHRIHDLPVDRGYVASLAIEEHPVEIAMRVHSARL